MKTVLRDFRTDFNQICETNAKKPAFITKTELGEKILSYGELQQRVDQCIRYFESECMLKEGDTLVTILPNSPEKLICFLAAMKAGVNFAPLPCTATQHEISNWVSITKPKVILSTPLRNVTLEFIETRFLFDAIDCNQQYEWLPSEQAVSGKTAIAMLYLSTSGSTGSPKALAIDINRLWSSGCVFADYHDLNEHELRFWNYLPMSYLGGLFNLGLIPLSIGASILIDAPFSGKTFLEYWQTIDRFEINALWLVPTIINGLLNFGARARSAKQNYAQKIKYAFVGTAPLAASKKRSFKDIFGVRLIENYGLSETTFISSEALKDKDEVYHEGSVGKILPYVDIKLKLDQHTDISEILVKTPYVFNGYLTDTGEIELPLDKNGFMPTGDLGRIDKEGFLVLSGRDRDIIKKGGNFVSLREIEVFVEKLTSVAEAAAVKVEHEFYGESYQLFIIPSQTADENLQQEISQYIHENFVQYKWPEDITLTDSFPKTSSGKVRKHLLTTDKEVAHG